jgi:SulP family sulfate permease
VVRHDGEGILIFETRDGAMEWMEERILEANGTKRKDDERPLVLRDFELFCDFDEDVLARLEGCMRRLTIAGAGKVFSCGEEGDEIFLVRKGSVRIMLPLESGKRHHIANISRGDFFGEMSFLDRKKRSADAEAKVPAELFSLSRSNLDALSLSDPAFGMRVFTHIALALAQRLRQTDAELQTLEER